MGKSCPALILLIYFILFQAETWTAETRRGQGDSRPGTWPATPLSIGLEEEACQPLSQAEESLCTKRETLKSERLVLELRKSVDYLGCFSSLL